MRGTVRGGTGATAPGRGLVHTPTHGDASLLLREAPNHPREGANRAGIRKDAGPNRLVAGAVRAAMVAASGRASPTCIMLNSHPRDDRLRDYVEDLLCREERAEVEHHLVRCEQCRTTVKLLRDRARDAAP